MSWAPSQTGELGSRPPSPLAVHTTASRAAESQACTTSRHPPTLHLKGSTCVGFILGHHVSTPALTCPDPDAMLTELQRRSLNGLATAASPITDRSEAHASYPYPPDCPRDFICGNRWKCRPGSERSCSASGGPLLLGAVGSGCSWQSALSWCRLWCGAKLSWPALSRRESALHAYCLALVLIVDSSWPEASAGTAAIVLQQSLSASPTPSTCGIATCRIRALHRRCICT